MTDKLTKEEVHYDGGAVHHHCGPVFHDDKYYCQHFEPSTHRVGRCDIVQGAIAPEMGCDRYKRVRKP